MTAGDNRVLCCDELKSGDFIEARINGVTHHRGEITELMPTMHLFWALCEDGRRRIIEFTEYEVFSHD